MLKKILSTALVATLLAGSLSIVPAYAAENKTIENSTTCTNEIKTISTRIKNNIPVRYDQKGNIVDATSENANTKVRKKLPSSYDLRDEGRVTSIKNQGDFGTCWDFASTASMESNILTKGLNNETEDTLDLSEAGNTWYLHSNTTDLNSPIYNEHVEDLSKGASGGNSLLAADSISSGYGAYPESLLDYDTFYDSLSIGYPDAYRFYSDYRLKDYTELDPSNIELVKQKIMENGATYYTYNSKKFIYHRTEDGIDTYYDSTKDNKPATSGHAVTIIGWDDNFSKDNFNPEDQPEHDGAWLIKNSWGEDRDLSGEGIEANEKYKGCFWVSYESKLYDITQFEMQTSENLENVYQHQVSALDYVDVNSAANIFTANGTEKLEQVNLGNLGKADVNISIYKLNDDYTSPVDGKLLSSFNSKIDYTGTHSIDVPDDVVLNKGDKFSVVIKDNGPEENELFLKYKEENYYSTETAGKSFFMTDDGQWTDVADEYESVSYMAIKAYTSNVTIDKSQLAETIEATKTFVADENIPQAELDTYAESIEVAKNVLANENATQIEINNANYSLKGKMEAFGKYCFYINSMEDFEKFYEELTTNNTYYKYIQLNTDLDFGDRVFDTPIYNDFAFTGTFNGNGHTIKNFTCKTAEHDNISAFFACTDGATIENITFDNAKSEGFSGASIITGHTYGTKFINCTLKNSSAQTFGLNGAATFAITSTDSSFIDCTIDNCSAIGGYQAALVTIDKYEIYECEPCKFENFTAENYTVKAITKVTDNMGSSLIYGGYSIDIFPVLTMTDNKYSVEEFCGNIESFEINGETHNYTDKAYIFDKAKDSTSIRINTSDNIDGSDFYYNYDLINKELSVLGYSGEETDIAIPSEELGAPVTKIDKDFDTTQLTSISIPGSIKTIPDSLFTCNRTLSSVTLGEGIEEIGEDAFSYCNIANVVIPDSVRSIGDMAFLDNDLNSVVLGKNIETIGKYAFGYELVGMRIFKNPNFIVNGYADTVAEDYAKENGFTFNDLSKNEPLIPEINYEVGDVNLDRTVNIMDATLIQKHLSGYCTLTEKQLSLADVDNSSDVTINDATICESNK